MPRFHRAAAGLSFGLILLACSALPALAQMRPSGFTTLVTAGSGSSVNGLLSAVAPEEMVDNAGSNPVWVNFGGISITAAPNVGYYLPAGQSFGISPGNAPLYMAAYGVGGTSTVYVTPGVGPTSFGGGGGSGGGGGTTQSDTMGWDGAAWQKIGASLNGSTYELDIEALAGSNLLSALTTSSIPVTTAAMTGTASTQLIPAPSGSLHNYVTELHCSNAHATVGTWVSILDGSTNIDTLAAGPAFEGHEMSLGGVPFRQPTAATALNVQDVTTGANVICSAKYFTGP